MPPASCWTTPPSTPRTAQQVGPDHRHPCRPVRQALGGPDRHRQRHRQPRDRQAGRRPDQEIPSHAHDQGHGLRSWRLGVLGLGAGGQGVPGPGRVDPWRGVHRPSPAGPAGRTGEDRSEVHRCRPVPARRVAAETGPWPGRGSGRLRERRGRRRQHCLRGPAGTHLRSQRDPGAEHRQPPRRTRGLQDPRRPEESRPPG